MSFLNRQAAYRASRLKRWIDFVFAGGMMRTKSELPHGF
jgi:hypothetical protein